MKLTTLARTVVGLGLVALPSLAAASPFVTLPREDVTTHGGIEVGISPFSSEFIDTTVFRFDPYGEFAIRPDVSIFGNLPIAYATDDGSGDGESGVGALVVGAAYAPNVSADAKIVLSAALGLPTASDNNFAVGLGTYGRITDLAQVAPDAVTPRFNAMAALRRDKLVAQGSLGVDIVIPTGDNGNDSLTLVRFGGGIGYDLGPALISGELSLLFNTEAEPDQDSTFTTVAFSARGNTGAVSPYGALVLPLDSDIRDLLPVIFTVGVEYRPPAM